METRENSERDFKAYGEPMEAVLKFKYLGRILTATDDDWSAVAGNLKKARRSWGRLARVLSREIADPKVSHTFYITSDMGCCQVHSDLLLHAQPLTVTILPLVDAKLRL